MILASESNLVSAALALGATKIKGWTARDLRLIAEARPMAQPEVAELRREIRAGRDPLGEAFCIARSAQRRRKLGATYTPYEIIRPMIAWARRGSPYRVVDPGCGSGRFLMEAAEAFPKARLIGTEIDPLAAIVARGNLAALSLHKRAHVLLTDFRSAKLDRVAGPTLFVGNPPYVRHHDISPRWKKWLSSEAHRQGFRASQLAGLHVHFFLATAILARPGDYGVFVTSAEWLDVNYGALVRSLLLNGLGGSSITILDPRAELFPDAATTGAITTFVVGASPTSIRLRNVRSVAELGLLDTGRPATRERLQSESRWTHLTRARRKLPRDHVELGEICRVHRGQVTGCNRLWIAGPHALRLPARVLFPTITRARELFANAPELRDASRLRCVVDLPTDLSVFRGAEREAVEAFLEMARGCGADQTYIARHRSPWWSVQLREPAPILATYMARRPPGFVLNSAGARHLNIAHGLYPREPLAKSILKGLVAYLARATRVCDGRTYAGGLTKFEPREMERIPVPTPETIVETAEGSTQAAGTCRGAA